MYFYDLKEKNISNIPVQNTAAALQASRETDTPIRLGGAKDVYGRYVSGYVGVFHAGSKTCTPFWNRYHEILAGDKFKIGERVIVNGQPATVERVWETQKYPFYCRYDGGMLSAHTADELRKEDKKVSSMYSFTVNDTAKIDIQRIIRECEEDTDAEAILVNGGGNCLLLLRDTFLSRFTTGDGMVVADERLKSAWGFRHVSVAMSPDGAKFHTYWCHAPGYTEIGGWAARTVNTDNASFAVREVLAAREYKRQIKVNVHVL